MDKKQIAVYRSALNNYDFLQELLQAGNHTPPSWMASDEDKRIFLGIYYGWMVANHGDKWEDHV